MANKISAQGACLCGATRIAATSVSSSVGTCHCGMCRKWVGGPWFALDCGTEVEFEGKDNIGVFSSSQWAERGFCKKCGTALFYRLNESGQMMMTPGLFDDLPGLNFDHQVFIDEKPSYYDFANETKNMTGAEVSAKYAPPKC